MHAKKCRRVQAAIGSLALGLLMQGCTSRTPEERVDVQTPPLAPIGPEEKNFSSYQPAKPFASQGQALLTRVAFTADGPPGYGIEARDWQVVAGKQTGAMTLAGAAFFEVGSGEGSLDSGGAKTELKAGVTFSVSQGQQFELSAGGSLPLSLRLYLVTAR
jgi:hypothetical protein